MPLHRINIRYCIPFLSFPDKLGQRKGGGSSSMEVRNTIRMHDMSPKGKVVLSTLQARGVPLRVRDLFKAVPFWSSMEQEMHLVLMERERDAWYDPSVANVLSNHSKIWLVQGYLGRRMGEQVVPFCVPSTLFRKWNTFLLESYRLLRVLDPFSLFFEKTVSAMEQFS